MWASSSVGTVRTPRVSVKQLGFFQIFPELHFRVHTGTAEVSFLLDLRSLRRFTDSTTGYFRPHLFAPAELNPSQPSAFLCSDIPVGPRDTTAYTLRSHGPLLRSSVSIKLLVEHQGGPNVVTNSPNGRITLVLRHRTWFKTVEVFMDTLDINYREIVVM